MNGMGQKLGVVYTIVTVVFFMILAVIFVLRLNLARVENASAASASLQLVRQTAREALSGPAVSDERFRDAMRGLVVQTPMVQVLVIYSYTGGTEYLWARNKDFLPSGEQNISRTVGIPQLRYNELTTLKVTDSFDSNNSRTYFVTGLYTVIGNSDVFPLLRDTLVLILLYALVTLLITVLLMVTSQRRPAVAGTKTASPLDNQSSGFRAVDPARERQDGPIAFEPDMDLLPVARTRFAESADSARGQPSESRPDGLVSQRTGLSFRGHLERRLTLELERAAFNEQDLSALVIRFPGLKDQAHLYVPAANLVLSHFAFEDLAFEYDQESFVVIIPNAELNAGIKSAEAFQKKAVPFVRQHRLTSPQIGLSSRNGRLTDGTQLLKEARQAAIRASRDATATIVGFHPDPQKYRAYVAGKDGA